MRLRKIKNAQDKLLTIDYVELLPISHKGEWHKRFDNHNPIYCEIGMGKGAFITKSAQKNPEMNYIGLEKEESIVWKATQKLDAKLENVLFVVGDASEFDMMFEENELDGLFLNFSDPWPKARHAKRRLTFKTFLDKYHKVLKPKAKIIMKTDNYSLYEFSLEQFHESQFRIIAKHENLHKVKNDIITTEYEEKFTGLGKQIYYIEVENEKDEII